MQTSGVEVLASILIVLSLIKLVVVLVNMGAWMNFVRIIYSRPKVTVIVSYALAGISLYILLQSGLTIIQILAVTLFVSFLMIPKFAPYADLIISSIEGGGVKQILKKQWLTVVVWLVLLGAGLYKLLCC